MRYIIIPLVALTLSLPIYAENNVPAKSDRNKEVMKKILEMQMRQFGGRVRQPNTERGAIIFVNAQKIVNRQVLEKVVKRLAMRFHFVIKISEADVESSNDQIVIRLEELPRKESILMAPENFWVSVNVSTLAKDNPPKAILESRFAKEAMRAFAFICGGTCSNDQGGLCMIVDKATDLDTIAADKYSPDIDVRITNNMKSTGIKPYRIAKYSNAVQEGWAPAPTNDAQKAIWDEIHAIPSKPIKIEYNEKRDRGK